MSCGFARRPPFKVIAAVDAEIAKPSHGEGKLDCNATYAENIGVRPLNLDIAGTASEDLVKRIGDTVSRRIEPGDITVLIACPPCTDFSRTKPTNHLVDSPKNSLVVKMAELVDLFRPEFVLMENARELIMGRNSHHYREFVRRVEGLGYHVSGGVHFLSKYGLPQSRERAMVIASRVGPVKTLDDLWEGWRLNHSAITVRHAIGHLNEIPLWANETGNDPMHQAPAFSSDIVRRRMEAIPRDGGSWYDLARHPEAETLLIDSMKDRLARNDLGSHADVYGRMAWDRPAPTIKRECAHVGNGRYCHPEQSRLLTAREMSLLQGFPDDYQFVSPSLTNRYRHIGDAVPPMISYQLSALVSWMKTGVKKRPTDWVLPGTSLRIDDVHPCATFSAESKQLILV